MKRIVIIALAALVLLGLAGPFLPLDFLKPGVAGAIARVLGRQVDIDGVSLSFFPAPALALSGVTIHEDPRAGIEPFVYAENVDAQVDLLGLLRGHRKFSQLRFTGATLNLVKTGTESSLSGSPFPYPDTGGPWNFQFFSGPPSGEVPAVQMRAGRVNIKFGQTKSVVYFSDADLDIALGDKGSLDLSFSGEPARTDRSAEEFGHFFIRGTVAPSSTGQRTNMRVELEPSSLDGIARLFGRAGFDLQGQVALNAQISGPGTNLEVKGEVEFDDNRRSSLLPQFGGKAALGLKGMLDLGLQTLKIESVSSASEPFSVAFSLSNFLSTPQWDVRLNLHEAPLATLYGAARQIGAPLPDKWGVQGSVTGTVEASSIAPVSGEFTANAPSVTLPDGSPFKADAATVTIAGNTFNLAPTLIQVSDTEAVTLEAAYTAGAGSEGGVTISTRGWKVAAAQSLGLRGVPLLGQMSQGTWRGTARFKHTSSGENVWTGDFDLINARVAIDGLAEPVRIISAAVSANTRRTAVSRVRATAGAIAFTGDYCWEPLAVHPHQFRINIDEADGAEVERLLRPTLERAGGFLERTLGIGAAPAPPEWLAARHAEGTLSIHNLNVADHAVSVDTARLLWDGPVVNITGLAGHIDDASATGTVSADLLGRAPKYHLEGRIEDAPYRGGTLDLEGVVDASGTGAKLLSSIRAQGTLDGRLIAFSPEAEFRGISGRFDTQVAGGALRWKFSGIEATLGGETYSGEGGSQPGGKIVLDLVSRGRQVRYTGSLLATVQP